MIYSMIKLLFSLTILMILISGCSSSKYDYTVHKPKVRYKPSAKALTKLNKRALGKPYIWAEERAYKGFDCSGLTYYNYGTMGIEIPRTANEQYHCGTPINRSNLQKGDLVFFATKRGRPHFASHVGIYLGDGKFEHASSAKKRVTISSLNSSYYSRHFIGARRYHSFDTCETDQGIRFAQSQPTRAIAYAESQEEPSQVQTLNNIQYQGNSTNQQSSQYFISVGRFSSIPSQLITKLQLSGYPTKIEQKENQIELEVGPFESANEAYSMLDLNRGLFGDSATVKEGL